MRVAFYGNICNTFFQVASAIRSISDIDAHLYVDRSHDMQMRPESDDPSLANGYPPWIHESRYLNRFTQLAPFSSPLVRELDRADVIVVSNNGPWFTQFTDRPTCFFVSGGDLNVLPFPLEYHGQYRGVRGKTLAMAQGFWQRRGIRRATEIWTQLYYPYLYSIDKLGVDRARVHNAYFPVILDTALFTHDPSAKDASEPWIRQIRDRADFVLFHPSRLMIRGNPRLHPARHAVMVKKNEILFEGFARFLRESGAKGAMLAMPDRTASRDVDTAKEILRSLGIEDHVIWLEPPRPEGFTRKELVKLYSVSDVVADDFGVGWFGAVALEALSMQCPLVSYIDDEVMLQMYPSHPILSSNTPEGVARHIGALYADPALRARLGREGRAWIEQHHAPESAGRTYFHRFVELADRLGIAAPSLRNSDADAIPAR